MTLPSRHARAATALLAAMLAPAWAAAQDVTSPTTPNVNPASNPSLAPATRQDDQDRRPAGTDARGGAGDAAGSELARPADDAAAPRGSDFLGTHQIDRFEAINQLRDELKSDNEDFASWVMLGELAQEVADDVPTAQASGYYKLAREAYEAAAKLRPDDRGVQAALEFVRAQEADASDFADARRNLTKTYLEARRQEISDGGGPTLRMFGAPGMGRAAMSGSGRGLADAPAGVGDDSNVAAPRPTAGVAATPLATGPAVAPPGSGAPGGIADPVSTPKAVAPGDRTTGGAVDPADAPARASAEADVLAPNRRDQAVGVRPTGGPSISTAAPGSPAAGAAGGAVRPGTGGAVVGDRLSVATHQAGAAAADVASVGRDSPAPGAIPTGSTPSPYLPGPTYYRPYAGADGQAVTYDAYRRAFFPPDSRPLDRRPATARNYFGPSAAGLGDDAILATDPGSAPPPTPPGSTGPASPAGVGSGPGGPAAGTTPGADRPASPELNPGSRVGPNDPPR